MQEHMVALSWSRRWRALFCGAVTMPLPDPLCSSPLDARKLPPPHTSASLQQWRSSDLHSTYSRELLATPRFRELLAILANIRPARPVGPLDATNAAILYGQQLGHDAVLGALLLSGTPFETPLELPAPDYGAEGVDFDKLL